MRVVPTEIVSAELRDLLLSAAFVLSDDARRAMTAALTEETTAQGRAVLERLLENAEIAARTCRPLCQDTGLVQVVVELGQETLLTGPPLPEAVDEGVRRAYELGFLRKSSCHPLTRQNLGDNTPASLELLLKPGDGLTILVLAKGGGCDNKSRLLNLPPVASRARVIEAVVQAVLEAGPDACPPLCLGVAVGGTFESAPRLAKRALMELWDGPPMTDEEQSLADELLQAVNATGLGPMGLGGRTTALGLRVVVKPAHLASLPVAVNVNCHSCRVGRASL
jgi:fumarate hydratase subunit alpha